MTEQERHDLRVAATRTREAARLLQSSTLLAMQADYSGCPSLAKARNYAENALIELDIYLENDEQEQS